MFEIKLRNFALFLSCLTYVCANDARIVGGSIASSGRWPWQGFLASTSSGSLFCGCSVISNRWVVTAAHCMDGLQESDVFVAVGSINSVTREPTAAVYLLSEAYPHPAYQSPSFDDDICLLRTTTTITFNTNIQAVALPSQGVDITPGSLCWITGWGKTASANEDSPSTLHEAQVPVVSNAQCNTWYAVDNIVVPSAKQFCAGYELGNVDTCQGDSGGPLVCNVTGSFVLEGLTSYGVGCALPRKPGIYTRVSNYVDWINRTMTENPGNFSNKQRGSYILIFTSFLLILLWR